MNDTRPRLILLHGFPFDGTLWEPQMSGLADAARVLTPDLRGFGRDEREVPDAMTMDAFADDVIALLDEQRIDRAVIGGLSMGGYVALSIVERYPDRVQALVLCNTRATADTLEAREGRYATAMRALEQGMDVIARGMVPQLIMPRTRTERPELATWLEELMKRQRPDAVAAASLGMALRPDRMALLPRITVPTLIITGEADTLMPLPTSQAMADAIPDNHLVIVPGAAHVSNLENAGFFNAELSAFLRGLP